ncbi:MAG TPA: hypothetical protein VFS10_22115 [Pyrinomonadaceae bacterium]|nr:hypothetical protein [Pyrinomonadaceae bacterium]
MSASQLPVACSLTEVELRERRGLLLERAGRAILESEELPDGFAYRFPEGDEWLGELAEVIRLERLCCPFLAFKLVVSPGGGPVWLELTGPPGTKEFLASLFG